MPIDNEKTDIEKIRDQIQSTDAVIEEDETNLDISEEENKKEDEGNKNEEVTNELSGEQNENEEVIEEEKREEEENKEEDEKVSKKVMLRRIAKANAAKQAAADEAERLKAELEELKGEREKGTPPTDEEIEKRIEIKATQKAAEKAFNDACNNLASAANSEDKDFSKNYKEIVEDFGYPSTHFLETLFSLDNGAKLLANLSKDPDKWEELQKLSPAKQAVELTKISESLKKPKTKAISQAPAPIKPVGNSARSPGALRDDMNDSDWIAQRNKEVAANPRMRR